MEEHNNNIDNNANIVVDRLSETDQWNNNTSPSSDTVIDPVQQQEIEEFQRLIQSQTSYLNQTNDDEETVHEKQNNCLVRTLIFVGYCLSTLLFTIHLWIQYFFVKYSYDDQTAVNLVNYVTAAQERAIDEYTRRKSGNTD
ncbi:hypothetical protein SBY92_005409 [Candida maltosa Xu316]|uniref:Transmembrane protein n=1 Tax=Candida maltosa (strain Xu316) TaxID=1245528 RepID=M3JW93_CANMX|nr:hypothetical protein G210_3084 [Candida maltosa Xu316]